MLKLSDKQLFILVSFFLLSLVIILNLKIPSQYKLSLILVGVIICYYQPKFIIPFLTSIVLVYISNKKISKFSHRKNNSPRKTIETFSDTDTAQFLTKMATVTDSNYLEKITKEDIQKLKDGDISLEGVQKNTLMRTKFLKKIFEVYFFEFPTDFPLALDLNLRYRSITNLRRQLNFKDITYQSSVGNDSFRNKAIKMLEDKTLHKLGLFIYQTKFLNLKNYFIKSLNHLGLLGLVNGNFELDDPAQTGKPVLKLIQKKAYEISILLFFLKYRETQQEFNFDTQLELEDMSLYSVIPTLVKHKLQVVDKPELKQESYFLMLADLLPQINVVLNNFTTDTDKFKLFPEEDIISKYITGKVEFNIVGLTESSSQNLIENNLDLLFGDMEKHLEKIKIVDFRIYRFSTEEQRRQTEMTVKSNYFLLLVMSGYLDDLIKVMTESKLVGGKKVDTEVYQNLISLYQKKRQKFQLQLQNEITMDEEYKFTNLQDKFYDNFFFYLGILINKKDTFTRTLVFPEPSLAPEPSTSDEAIPRNTISDYQQNLYELDLDKFLDQDNRKERQEEALNKYYQFLDKEKYESVQDLGKLAEERNKELKIRELSLNQIVDNFGQEVFAIIDELILVFKNFYQDYDLSNFRGEIKEASPSPSPNPSHKSKFDKYIMLVKTILDILLQENRILYTGFILVVLAIFIYFIDSSSSQSTAVASAIPSSSGIRSILDLLKL